MNGDTDGAGHRPTSTVTDGAAHRPTTTATPLRAAAAGGSGIDPPVLIGQLLRLARNRTGMELAWVSRFGGGANAFEITSGSDGMELEEGTSVPLEDSYCIRVLDGRLPNVVPDAKADPRTNRLPATAAMDIGSYVGVPLTTPSGAAKGMLCAVRRSANPDLGRAQVEFLELLAALISEILVDDRLSHEERQARRDRVGGILATGQLRTVLQPIVDIAGGAVSGAEALARFPGAQAPPDVWFAEASSVGMGAALELAAVRVALGCLDELPASVYLSVNVSPALTAEPELHDLLLRSAPERLVLELTEHRAVQDYDVLNRQLRRFRAAGVRIAIDDVGAGFASFNHVLQLEPDILKIDRSITRDVDSDSVRRGLVRGIVGVARELGAAVVAEGVETEVELDALHALDVGYAQGWFIAKPAPPPLAVTTTPVGRDRGGAAR